MTPQAEAALLRDIAAINGKLDAQKLQLDLHERRDEERHEGMLAAVERLEAWRDRVRDEAEATGRQEVARLEAALARVRDEERAAARADAATAQTRRHDWIKSVAIVLLAALCGGCGAALAHALGWH